MLPEGISATEMLVYTGRVGSTEQAAQISSTLENRVVYYTSDRTLFPGEGMTILAKLPKGSIARPDGVTETYWFWQDNKNVIIGFLVLILVTAYYFITWIEKCSYCCKY